MASTRDRKGAEIVHELFGANLQQQGRGFYVALELLAMIRGTYEIDPANVLAPGSELVRYRRSSHDLARRIATATHVPDQELDAAVQGPRSLETLQALLSSLVITVPGRRRTPKWYAAHLYPFVGELVHYNAVERRRIPAIERYVFRDGGGLAHHILRTDQDAPRLRRIRAGLQDLVRDSETALGRIAAALRSHDTAPKAEPFADESERQTDPHEEDSQWPDTLRRGVDRIVSRRAIPAAKRVEQVLHWTPYCVARHQLRLARKHLGLPTDTIPVDLTSDANPLRARSQAVMEGFRWNIVQAIVSTARGQQKRSAPEQRQSFERYTVDNASFASSPRAFFSETLAAVGALNATVGRRHFTFKAPMLEALAAAMIEPGHEVEFHNFCDTLYDRLDLVIDDRSARMAEFTIDIDEGVFATNAASFRSKLAAVGLLTHYSDATSMVHGETR